MATPEFITAAANSWQGYYSDHQAVSVAIKYLHIAATMVGGGLAISLDRQVFTAVRNTGEIRATALRQLHGAHRTVIAALVVSTVSGVLMTAADLDTFLGSKVFWMKIAVFTALLANGAILRVAGTAAAQDESAAWRRLKITSIVSLALWLLTTFIGTLLTVAA